MTDYTSLKLLIIEDDEDWQSLIGDVATFLGHTFVFAQNLEEAEAALEKAETEEEPFSVVTIDWAFELGQEKRKYQLGRQILRRLKTKYPHLGCIIISGEMDVAHGLLELRDQYNLDSYIPKIRFDEQTFEKAINKAMTRIQSVQSEDMPEPNDHQFLVQLQKRILEHFAEEEIIQICFELNVDYELLAGKTKRGKTMNLVKQLDQHQRLTELVNLCGELRPLLPWQET